MAYIVLDIRKRLCCERRNVAYMDWDRGACMLCPMACPMSMRMFFRPSRWLFRHLVRPRITSVLAQCLLCRVGCLSKHPERQCFWLLETRRRRLGRDIQLCKVRRQIVTVDVVAVVFTSDVRTWPCHRGQRVCPIPCQNGNLGKHAVMHGGCMRRCKLGPACQHPSNQCLRHEIPRCGCHP